MYIPVSIALIQQVDHIANLVLFVIHKQQNKLYNKMYRQANSLCISLANHFLLYHCYFTAVSIIGYDSILLARLEPSFGTIALNPVSSRLLQFGNFHL